MASFATESHAKTASPIAPRGGKHERKANCDSLWLNAARLLGRWRCPLRPRSSLAAAQWAKTETPLSRRVWPRVRFLRPG